MPILNSPKFKFLLRVRISLKKISDDFPKGGIHISPITFRSIALQYEYNSCNDDLLTPDFCYSLPKIEFRLTRATLRE